MQERTNDLTDVIEQNITDLIARRRREERAQSRQERLAGAITRFAGSMRFVYIHLAFYGGWILVNLGGLGLPPFDPTFVVLAMVASVEAIFLSTFILITQNRMAALADKRADLDLQISLLAEHEITHVLVLVRDMAARMGVEASQNPELESLARNVHPEHVLDSMEQAEMRASAPEDDEAPES
jgi:uncharacterized membrane protein